MGKCKREKVQQKGKEAKKISLDDFSCAQENFENQKNENQGVWREMKTVLLLGHRHFPYDP